MILSDYTGQLRYVLGPADMTGSVIASAQVEDSSATGQYSVGITFTSKGSVDFDNVAASRYACYQEDTSNPPYCSEEAIELDGVVESAPTIQAARFNGTAVIAGSAPAPFTSTQATNLAMILNVLSLRQNRD